MEVKQIGVPAAFLHPDPNRTVFQQKTLAYIENDMANYLAFNQCIPVLIPDLMDMALVPFLESLDGFLFQGGTDLSSKTYGAYPLDFDRWPGDEPRDQFELKIMDFAVEHKKPIFGICRGCQLINAYFGGTLVQDIETQLETKVKHRDPEIYDRNTHDITVKEGTYLSQIYKGKVQVNSIHHQAIDQLAPGFEVCAVSSEDGIIEAIAHHNMDKHYVLGVQWHPEFSHTLNDELADPHVLLLDFLKACKQT
jgi:putative glutamine amidotransferase